MADTPKDPKAKNEESKPKKKKPNLTLDIDDVDTSDVLERKISP